MRRHYVASSQFDVIETYCACWLYCCRQSLYGIFLQLTEEEQELRRIRREKNKLAAQKCRSKKRERADILEAVSIHVFKTQISEREGCFRILEREREGERERERETECQLLSEKAQLLHA